MRILEVHTDAAMPCKKRTNSSSGFQETGARLDGSNEVPKTKYACIVEAHKSTRQRVEPSLPQKHEDHIAGKGYHSMNLYHLVHKFIPLPQAMNNPDAKAAEDKEWKKLETIPAWQWDRLKSKKEVILDTQKDKRKVHFATLMDVSSQKCGVRAHIPEVQGSNRTSRRHR